jgi:polar amino acid transport system substrate-binding protein
VKILTLLAIVFSLNILAKNKDVINISTGEWPPYLSKNEKDYGCVGKVIVDSFAKEGVSVKFTFFPWKRAYQLAKSGQYDATAYWFDRPDRRKDFIFSDSNLSIEESFFFSRVEDSFDWKKFSDLKGKKIIVNRGYTYTKEFWESVQKYNLKILKSNNENQNFRLLTSKRGDITIIAGPIAKEYLKLSSREIRDSVVMHPRPAIITKGYLLFSRVGARKSNFKEAFDRGLMKVMSNKAYKQKYLKDCSKL